jgi:hypothetical protein
VCDGAQAGSVGQSRAIEQIRIRTTGTSAHVCYKVHIAGYGWNNNNGTSLPYCNVQVAGIVGIRIEGIEILDSSLLSNESLFYRTHVQNRGWIDTVWNGQLGGTTGASLRLEAIQISLGARPRCPNQGWYVYTNTPHTDALWVHSLPFNPPTLPTSLQPTCDVATFYYGDVGLAFDFPDNQIKLTAASEWYQYGPSSGVHLYVPFDPYDNIALTTLHAGGTTSYEHAAERTWTSSPNGTGITMMDMKNM